MWYKFGLTGFMGFYIWSEWEGKRQTDRQQRERVEKERDRQTKRQGRERERQTDKETG